MLDCDGSVCFAECEKRHLDEVEATRDDGSWSFPTKPKVIICAGPERSGSTWLYNAVRLLHRVARVPCDSYWIHTLTEEKLRERVSSNGGGASVCVKTHEWEADYASWVSRASSCIILTHRDLRGVIASYRRAGWAHDLPRKYVDDHFKWRQICTMDIKYEDLVRNGIGQLNALAVHLELEVAEDGINEVHAALKTLQSSSSGGPDQVTKCWPGHVSINTMQYHDVGTTSDEELNRLSDDRCSKSVFDRFAEYMSAYGYHE